MKTKLFSKKIQSAQYACYVLTLRMFQTLIDLNPEMIL